MFAERTPKQLGQSLPSDTTAVSIYSPGDGITARITDIYICNVTGSSADFRIFVDDDGTTYSTATALYYDVAQGANTTTHVETNLYMNNSSGNIAVRTDTNSALCFTIFGEEFSTT